MIIFDLDGTLADCEHRRHYVDPSKNPDLIQLDNKPNGKGDWVYKANYPNAIYKWSADWKAFYEACDRDGYIVSALECLISLRPRYPVEIWSGRSESVRNKTVDWLSKYEPYLGWISKIPLKMRPIGDNTPDDQLKERWLNERCADLMEARMEDRNPRNHDIQFVFDDRPKVVRMWKQRGIFVFNCCQHDEEF
jgi:hypothetical protein